jgi:hypothetical protein
MTKLSDLYYAGGANAIAQPVVQGKYQTVNDPVNSNVTSSWALAKSLTVQETGEYMCTYHAGFQTDQTIRYYQAQFYVNNGGGSVAVPDSIITTTCPNNNVAGGNNEYAVATNTVELSLNAGDSLELWVVSGDGIGQTGGLDTTTITIVPKVLNSVTTTMTDAELTARVQPATASASGAIKSYTSSGDSGEAVFESGVYTPVFTSVSGNTNSYTNPSGSYIRIGNIVYVTVRCSYNQVSTGNTYHKITLPIPSTFTSYDEVQGTCATYRTTISNYAGMVEGATANDYVTAYMVVEATSTTFFNATFTYVIK